MRLHLVQPDIASMNPEANRARAAELVRGAGVGPGALVALPELFSTGVLPPDFDAAAADGLARADCDFLAGLARELRAHVLAGVLERRGGALGNMCVLLDPDGREVLRYRKIHPFSLGGEDRIFGGGDAVEVAAVEGFSLQPAVCYDLRFPELFRAGARRGANLFVVPANWPRGRREHWDVLLRARAIENQAYVVGVNCTGVQYGTAYAGGSRVVSPKGEVLADAGEGEGVLTADIAPRHVESWRRTFPALRDRKPEEFWGGVG